MIESYLTNADILKAEPILGDEYRSGQTTWDDLRYQSFDEMIQDLKNQNLEVRKLCIRLSLQTSDTKTATYDGSTSDQDFLNRERLVIDVTDITGTFTFAIQGRNDSDDSWSDVKTGISVTASTNVLINSSSLVPKIYKFYRIRITTAGTTITFSADLVEDTYTNLHRLKCLAKIFLSLITYDPDGVFERKYEKYQELYEIALQNWKFPYDENDDEEIDEDESEENINLNVRFC